VPVHGPLVVGREAAADLSLNDPRISRRHARVTPLGAELMVEDLGSANGTFVNGAPIHGRAQVRAGDELLLGTTVIAVRSSAQVHAQPSAVRAVPPALATPPRQPTYVAPVAIQPAQREPIGPSDLTRLLDVRTRAQARLAPVAMLVVVALALVLYFGTR
jgi:pSer/pThr/pTyr-binding forkhead associated (FHA) protein